MEHFKNKQVNFNKLSAYGFKFDNQTYIYQHTLADCGFILTIQINTEQKITIELIDPALNEPYTLHLVKTATGDFVGNVKKQYDNLLQEIADKCFEPHIFQFTQSQEMIDYVEDTYSNHLEFLWKNSNNAIWRRSDNNKWYAAMLHVSKRKLGLESDEIVEVINLRTDEIEIIDNIHYFPAFHMNKKHWISIILDYSVTTPKLCKRLDKSYQLAKKK